MTDYDPATIETDVSPSGAAFIWFACALIWLVYAPISLLLPARRYSQHTADKRSDGGSDQFHNGEI